MKRFRKYKPIRLIKRFYKSHRKLFVFAGLLVFPIIIDLFYHIPCNFFYLKENALLSFYGVALGIFVTFSTFYTEKKKEKIERDNKLKPYISVELEARKDGYFDIILTKLKNAIITDVFLYDVPLDNALPLTKKYNVNFYPDNEKGEAIDLSNYDSGLIDNDGYPKYILISCYDEEDRMWQGEYIKLSNSDRIVYQLKEMDLV